MACTIALARRWRWRLNGLRTPPRAPWYPLSAKVITFALVNASTTPWMRAAVRSWVDPGSAADALILTMAARS